MKKIAITVFAAFLLAGSMLISPAVENLQAHGGYHHNYKGYGHG